MKRKINGQLIIITTLFMLVCISLCTLQFYKSFKNEVLSELKAYATAMSAIENFENENIVIGNSKIRVTIIKEDGTVSYDSRVELERLDNHNSRPEVIAARKSGEGHIIRNSDTIELNTFYYAILLENGSIVRTSKNADSLASTFIRAFPTIMISTGVLWIFCIVLSHILTKSILRPVEQLVSNIDKDVEIRTYKELQPIMDTLRQQHRDIMKNANMRQEFTANISHELKTPLTAISGYSELIENGMATGEDAKRFAGEIYRNSNRLLNLINDIIRLSSLDSISEKEIVFEKVELSGLAKSCVDLLEGTAKRNEISIEYVGEEAYVTANREMLEELIINIGGNAVRYNKPKGKVFVNVSKKDEKVVLSIRDTGIGISEADQERIFERFYRVDKSRSKETGGTGLGLAIVKHIVAQHKNATLNLESEVGKGTTVTVVFCEK